MQIWKHVSVIPLELVGVGPMWGSIDSFGDPLDAYLSELLPYSSFYLIWYMVNVKKKVGDREALRYRRWDRGRSRNAKGQTRVGWKELLAWATAGEDDWAAELHFYFLGDKKIFDGRGNVESPHPRDGLLEERAGAADRADVWDPGGTHNIRLEKVDPS